MVVKPMSMLTKSGESGVSTSLVVNGTRYSSAKKQQSRSQSIKSSNNYLYSDHPNHTTTTTTTTSPEQLMTRRGPSHHVATTTNEPTLDNVKFETKFERDNIGNITTNSVQAAGVGAKIDQQQELGGHHPSLHSPEMLSTKGHAVTRVDSRDELSSLRSRLASLRAGGQVPEGGNHRHLSNGAGSIVVLDSGSEELLRRKSSSPAKHGGGMANRAQRITTLHGTGVEPRSVDDIATPAAMQVIVEKSKKERSSTRSGRNRQQQQQTTVNGVQEDLSNGEFQMVYEKDQEQKMTTTMLSSNPVRQAVHEIAEKARRSRNRIHHQGTTDAVDHVEKVEGKVDDAVVGAKPSLPGVAKMGSSMFQDVLDEASRIHHHHPRSSLQQQQQQVSSVDVVARDSPRGDVLVTESNGRSSFNFHHDGLRLRGAGHSVSPLRSGGHEVREDSVRGFTVKGIQGDRTELHPAAHPSSMEKEGGDHSSNNYGGNLLQPRSTARAAPLHHGHVDSPVIKHNSSSLRSFHSGYEREAELHSLHRNHHVAPAEHSNRGRETGSSRKAGNKSGQTWYA